MKTNYFFITLITLATFVNLHCGGGKDEDSDPCALTTCYNGGVCVDGDCECPDWFEGANCSEQVRDKFLGSYSGMLTAESAFGYVEGPATINFGRNVNGIQLISIDNGWVYGQLTNTTGNFTIPPQQANGLSVSAGYGYFSGNQVYYTLGGTSTGGDTQIYTFSGSR